MNNEFVFSLLIKLLFTKFLFLVVTAANTEIISHVLNILFKVTGLNPKLLILLFDNQGSKTFISLVNGTNLGYKDFAKSPNTNNPIFFPYKSDAFKLLSNPYSSLPFTKSK